MKENKMTFEEASAELNKIVDSLNAGNAPLNEMVSLYEKGVELVNYCSKLLNEYDGRIEKAMSAADEMEVL